MLETLISSTNGDSFTLRNAIIIILSSSLLGLFISFMYNKTYKKSSNNDFSITLIMLPVIISIIILLVGNNVARAFSLAGAFSIIRFRSAPASAKEITYVFFSLAVGLTCGMGYIGYAIIFTIILCGLMFLLTKNKLFSTNGKSMNLKITIPENLNYDGVFDEVFEKYTNSYNIEMIRTRDFGSLFELNYSIILKSDINQKNFLDDLRCKNGNLNITLTCSEYDIKA